MSFFPARSDPAQNEGWSCQGACGNYLDDNSVVVAMNRDQYQGYVCQNACVEILDVDTGRTQRFQVADSCTGCGWGGIDLTLAGVRAFGRNPYDWQSMKFPIRWSFC